MNMSVNCRLYYFDLLKLFAMYLVVVGHCIQYLYSNYQTNPLWLAIYTFHVPLFLVVSGFFFRPDRFQDFSFTRIYLKKRFVTFIQPCVIVSLFLFTILFFLDFFFHKNLLTPQKFTDILILDQWFLKSLLLDTFIVALLYSCKRIVIRVIYSVVIALFLLFQPSLDLWYVRDTLPYFILGIGLRKMNNLFPITSLWFLLLSVVICIVLYSGYEISYSSQFTPLGPSLLSLYIYVYRFIFAASISFVFISLFAILFNSSFILKGEMKTVNKYIYLGKLTLYIYIIQYLVLERLLCYVHLPIIISQDLDTFIIVPIIALGIIMMCIFIKLL